MCNIPYPHTLLLQKPIVIEQQYENGEVMKWGGVFAFCHWSGLLGNEDRVHYLSMASVVNFLEHDFFTTKMTQQKRNYVFETTKVYTGYVIPYTILSKVEYGVKVSKIIFIATIAFNSRKPMLFSIFPRPYLCV